MDQTEASEYKDYITVVHHHSAFYAVRMVFNKDHERYYAVNQRSNGFLTEESASRKAVKLAKALGLEVRP